jgi:hypothetical protein
MNVRNMGKVNSWCRLAAICLLGITIPGQAQVNSGIFYTSIFAKTAPYKRVVGFGKDAQSWWLKDVNGDGKDDAIAYYPNGRWQVALSDGIHFTNPADYLVYQPPEGTEVKQLQPLMGDVNGDGKQDVVFFDGTKGNWYAALSTGTTFATPVLWTNGKGTGTATPLLADVNGDGKADAVFFDAAKGSWYVGLSDGTNSFKNFSAWITGLGQDVHQPLLGDVNGDGKADALYFDSKTGNWSVALSDGKQFSGPAIWKTGFGTGADKGLVYDIDRDGKADAVYFNKAEWGVCYSTGTAFDASHQQRWITGHRPATIISRGNRPAPEAVMIGNVSGKAAGACVVSAGEWLVLENTNKQATVEAPLVDTWTAWGNEYTPQLPGNIGTYDASDPAVNDQQIKMMHDAGFTYIMLDITNGRNDWVDDRGKRFIERIRHWNNQLTGNQHKMYFCISMGGAREFKGQAAANACEGESKRTWDEFYVPYQDLYYNMNGKPLLIHFVWQPENSDDIKNFESTMPYYRKFTVRWMYNEIKDQPKYANAYGWPILEKTGNPAGKEVMDVSPGFWNGLVGTSREQGEVYRNQWLRVLQHKPQSIWLNSFNETWEHTSVEPSHIEPAPNTSNFISTWTDYYGNRMDDFYWIMTRQYNRLFMYGELFQHTYLQEQGSNDIYIVNERTIDKYGTNRPHMAPVLLVPKGFINSFKGKVCNESLEIIGQVSKINNKMTGTTVAEQDIKPLPYGNIQVEGELATRALKNYDRLESDIYTPANVFPEKHAGPSEGWPGDYEGRIILGLTLQAQATHREPKYLATLMKMLPQQLNSKGYLGPVMTDSIAEQQLSGHGWFLRAMCEYYQWKKDPAVKKYISDIIQNLALPTKGYHRVYPIDPATRIKHVSEAAGTQQNAIGRWQLSSDIGCDFIFMDGVIQAYSLFPSPELKGLIDEMIGRFLQMDLVAINAQTHATLTGLRGMLRYYEITKDPYLLTEAVKRYKLYRDEATTANFENFNWFERPEWTEPCAIVDAFMVATQLWQHTANPLYLHDAQLTYYNALAHTQRHNGGFGLDNCPGPVVNTLRVLENEAYWCCTMRGGEGMAQAIRYNYFTGNNRLAVPFFNTSQATFTFNKQQVEIRQESKYPFEGKVSLSVIRSDVKTPVQLSLFAPTWADNFQVNLNGKSVPFELVDGFVVVKANLGKGVRIDYTFDMQPRFTPMANTLHARPGYYNISYGPLLLGYAGNKETTLNSQSALERLSEKIWGIKGTNTQLTPIFHLLDPAVKKDSIYTKQVLFQIVR